MKNLIVTFVTLAVLVFLLFNACTEKIDIATEIENVRAVLVQYHNAIENEDIELISTIYAHDDDIVQYNDVVKWMGWTEVKSGFKEWFSNSENIKFTYRDEIIKVQVSGKAAWISFIQGGSIIYKNQLLDNNDARTTFGLEKQNGKWVIVQVHFSTISEKSVLE